MRGLVENQMGLCKRCGVWHPYLTCKCRPLVMPIDAWPGVETVRWRWSMLWRADWWSVPRNRYWLGVRRWWCHRFGHDDVTVTPIHPGEHHVIACQRCFRAIDLESDDVQARTGRAVYHVTR